MEAVWTRNFVESSISELFLAQCTFTKAHTTGLSRAIVAKKNLCALSMVETITVAGLSKPSLLNGVYRNQNGIGISPLTSPIATSTPAPLPFSCSLGKDKMEEMIAQCHVRNLTFSSATEGFFRGLQKNKSLEKVHARLDPSFQKHGKLFWKALADAIKENSTARELNLKGIEHAVNDLDPVLMEYLFQSVIQNYRMHDILLSDVQFYHEKPKEDIAALQDAWKRICVILKLNKAGRRYRQPAIGEQIGQVHYGNHAKRDTQLLKENGVSVLSLVSHDLDCLFTCLQEDPYLCDIKQHYAPTSCNSDAKDSSPMASGKKRTHELVN
uniref:Uncharacterized protein n=2 Tax=Entomoneis paludosa TaxID=265537 RepID=A0A7S3DWW1_9STRA|mmetsp:Transcript_7322/g.15256  ORF Transcript_7322/g.15256 Transcript_7322/m.15256 type:complete len:326 (+) Transcript_7322:21-998(+)